MTTEKPTPATDDEIARGVIANCGSLPHDDDCIGAMWPKIKARIEADRAKILPSSCSSSHPEIRYQGETCPLCEALRVLAEAREMVAMLDDYPIGSAAVKGMYATLNHIDAILSRPSSDPADEKPRPGESLPAYMGRMLAKPGAGEEGK